ncbi:ADP-dependent glucokinase [uncultured archaeon]|nr:ADP-dependent glucokinase [uncultured archaeon]
MNSMKIICAYPVNLDAVFNVGEELSNITRESGAYLPEIFGSMDDLIAALVFCMQEGIGSELLIDSPGLAGQIEAKFSWRHFLGGNAGIMANVLAKMGAQVILNAPALSHRMAGMIDPRVLLPVSGIPMPPLQAAGEREMVHFVFQFKAGDFIIARGMKITAPKDNRLIATYDPVNTRLESGADFDEFCQNTISEFHGALLSGFHLAPSANYREIFSQKIGQIKSWKEKNPDIFIHAEMGSFQKPEIMNYLLPRLPVDSLGMNEDELAATVGQLNGWRDCMQAARGLQARLGLPRVAIHTRDYILSVTKIGLIDPEDELRALRRGADYAAALAATGSAWGPPPAGVRPEGQEAIDQFCQDSATPFDRGAFKESEGTVLSLMSSLQTEKPKFTVGLGDTATAAAFYEEISAIRH